MGKRENHLPGRRGLRCDRKLMTERIMFICPIQHLVLKGSVVIAAD